MNTAIHKQVKDISQQSFIGFKLGDTFETAGFLAGLSDDPLVWRLTETNFSKTEFIFSVSYMGVAVGEFAINPSKVGEVDQI